MLDGNDLRAEFARYLTEHTHTRWGLDAALMHVCRMAYEQGVKDGSNAEKFCCRCGMAGHLSKDCRWPTSAMSAATHSCLTTASAQIA